MQDHSQKKQKKIKNLKVEESTKPNLLQSASEEITVEEDVNSIKQKNNAVKLNDVNIQLTEKTFKFVINLLVD